MTEMARALLEVYPTMALDQYESHEFYGKKVKTLDAALQALGKKIVGDRVKVKVDPGKKTCGMKVNGKKNSMKTTFWS